MRVGGAVFRSWDENEKLFSLLEIAEEKKKKRRN